MLPTSTDLSTLIRPNGDPIVWPSTANCFLEEYESLPPELAEQYEYNENTHAWDLPEATWINWRKHGPYWFDSSNPNYIPCTIGGSDASTLYDGSELSKLLMLYEGQHGSHYSSNIELWCEKMNIPFKYDKNEDHEIFDIGHIEEESIRQYFVWQYKKDHPQDDIQIWNDCRFYESTVVPGLVCNTDGAIRINGIQGILECKTCQLTSPDRSIWMSGNVPLKYYIQCCTYMLCLNLPYAYICVKLGMGDIMYFYIERNFEIEEYLIKMLSEFLQCVKTGKEPDFSEQSAEAIARYWRRKSGPYVPDAVPVELSTSMMPILKQIGTINAELERINERKSELEENRLVLLNKNIFPLFGDANFGRIKISDDETLEIHLKKKPARRNPINIEKLKKENPELYKRYIQNKEDFNSKLFRKENAVIASNYEEIGNLTDEKQNFCEITYVSRSK